MSERLRFFLAALVALCGAAYAVTSIRALPQPEIDRNMLFVPSGGLVRGGASGYENLMADVLWLSLLQYFGERYFASNRRMVNLEKMFRLITALDSRFWFSYWLGAWALADNGQPEAALDLLQFGERHNPMEASYPYTQGFVHFLMRSDYESAAQCFVRAAEKPVLEWPEQRRFSQSMAARMYRELGRRELALQIWLNMREQSTDRALKDIATRNAQRLQAEIESGAPPSRGARSHR
ncbi:MAG: hypothetical protein VKN33_04845 [Candidatus Sericytochromatia bacterium]|nr:hypothetical protein [Candidatus Sericytochromatia bacterium]